MQAESSWTSNWKLAAKKQWNMVCGTYNPKNLFSEEELQLRTVSYALILAGLYCLE